MSDAPRREEPTQIEVARLESRVSTLEQLIEVHERLAREQAARLEKAMAYARERTEQLARSEEELRRQASILRLVLDSMTDAVTVVDDRGALVLQNPAAERILGRMPSGASLGDASTIHEPALYLPDQATPWPGAEHPLARALRGETVDQLELYAKRPAPDLEPRTLRRPPEGAPDEAADDEAPRSLRAPPTYELAGDQPDGLFLTVTSSPMRRKDGTISGAVAVFRDATEKKRLIEDLEAKNRALTESEQGKGELVERLRYAIDEVSTPVLELWDDVLALPIIGVVDSRRCGQIMEKLLEAIVERQCRYVIIDVTGVDIIDTRTADHFLKLTKAVQLLGARCRITGIRPAVAQTLVQLGIDLRGLETSRNLKHALRDTVRLAAAAPAQGKSTSSPPTLQQIAARKETPR